MLDWKQQSGGISSWHEKILYHVTALFYRTLGKIQMKNYRTAMVILLLCYVIMISSPLSPVSLDLTIKALFTVVYI